MVTELDPNRTDYLINVYRLCSYSIDIERTKREKTIYMRATHATFSGKPASCIIEAGKPSSIIEWIDNQHYDTRKTTIVFDKVNKPEKLTYNGEDVNFFEFHTDYFKNGEHRDLSEQIDALIGNHRQVIAKLKAKLKDVENRTIDLRKRLAE